MVSRSSTPLCERCNQPTDSLVVCSACGLLRLPEGLDHFSLFEQEVRYGIDQARLRQRYFELSRLTHPDSLLNRSDEQRWIGLQLSARINEAYAALADPVQRAETMLRILGGASAAEDKAVPPETLARTLELQEELEEALAAGDSQAIASLKERISSEETQLLSRIASLAQRLPDDPSARAPLRAALNALRYSARLQDAVNASQGEAANGPR